MIRDGIQGLLIACSSSWGLLQIIFFMGSGIVNIPINLIMNRDCVTLKKYAFELVDMHYI